MFENPPEDTATCGYSWIHEEYLVVTIATNNDMPQHARLMDTLKLWHAVELRKAPKRNRALNSQEDRAAKNFVPYNICPNSFKQSRKKAPPKVNEFSKSVKKSSSLCDMSHHLVSRNTAQKQVMRGSTFCYTRRWTGLHNTIGSRIVFACSSAQ